MTTLNVEKRTAFFILGRLALALALMGQTVACDGGREGDRCIPTSVGFSHNDCNENLTCTTIVDPVSGATCGESYCCPTNGTSSNPVCNGTLIGPAPDGAPGYCPVPATAPAATMIDAATAGDAPTAVEASPEAAGDAPAAVDASPEAAADAPSE